MRTLIVYVEIEKPMQFLIVDGDFKRFNGVIVNAVNGNGFEQEFCDWMFNKETGEINNLEKWSEDESILENKQWDKVAICTFLP
jgi:hypothetical protein